jgi:hypothetical protein
MFERLVTRVRQIAEGLSHPAYGCCSGDPIAWEKDLLRQKAEAADAARAAVPGAPASPAPLPADSAH